MRSCRCHRHYFKHITYTQTHTQSLTDTAKADKKEQVCPLIKATAETLRLLPTAAAAAAETVQN